MPMGLGWCLRCSGCGVLEEPKPLTQASICKAALAGSRGWGEAPGFSAKDTLHPKPAQGRCSIPAPMPSLLSN